MRTVIVMLAIGCSAGPKSAPDTPSAAPPDAAPTAPALPALPLATSSRWIVDATGARVKLVSVNWYGAESSDFVVGGLDRAPLPAIAARIRALGFNSVRLPWSNELYETNPIAPPIGSRPTPRSPASARSTCSTP